MFGEEHGVAFYGERGQHGGAVCESVVADVVGYQMVGEEDFEEEDGNGANGVKIGLQGRGEVAGGWGGFGGVRRRGC